MMQDARNVYRTTRLLSIAKYVERIGDHATNLAEMVVFMVRGKDIRHMGRLEEAPERHAPHGVLFVCVRNSARSQIAEAWAKKLLPAGVRVYSAGSDPADSVHPMVARVMKEVGIDVSGQRPKPISEIPLGHVDTVITLCAEEVCPALPGDLRPLSWALPDPAAVLDSEAESLEAFRRVRDELRRRIEGMVRS